MAVDYGWGALEPLTEPFRQAWRSERRVIDDRPVPSGDIDFECIDRCRIAASLRFPTLENLLGCPHFHKMIHSQPRGGPIFDAPEIKF